MDLRNWLAGFRFHSLHHTPTRRRHRNSLHIPTVGLYCEALEDRTLLATLTVDDSGGADFTSVQAAITAASNGDTILVSPGDYLADASQNGTPAFFIGKQLAILSTGGSAQTVLRVPRGQATAVSIFTSNVTLQGFRILDGNQGVTVQDFLTNAPVSNVVLRDLDIAPDLLGPAHGLALRNTQASVVDQVVIRNARDNGIFIDLGSVNNVVMNSRVEATINQHAFAIKDSLFNTLVGNTVTGSGFHGIIVINSSHNRIESNVISGHQFDGITVTDGSSGNRIVQNVVGSNKASLPGFNPGTGVFLNNNSNGNYVFNNFLQGHGETGLAIFSSHNNTIQANMIQLNKQGGIFITDGNQVGFANPFGQPLNNIIHDNIINSPLGNSGIIVRFAQNLDVAGNFLMNATGGIEINSVNGVEFYENHLINLSGFGERIENSVNVRIFRNRHNNVANIFAFAPSGVQFDNGPNLGGNFYTNHLASGNPSPGNTPFNNIIFDLIGNRGGPYVDRFPFASETLGLPYTVNVLDPVAGLDVTPGSTKTIRWESTGSVFVDIFLINTATGALTNLTANLPNIGIFNWTVGPTLPAGVYQIIINSKNSVGNFTGAQGASNLFNVTPAGLILNAPVSREVLTIARNLRVAWNGGPNLKTVSVRAANSQTWMDLAVDAPGSFVDVIIPAAIQGAFVLRVRDQVTGAADSTDGFINLQNRYAAGTGPGLASQVKVFDADGQLRLSTFPYGPFGGGARVAVGDLTGDGVAEVIIGAGPGGGPHVRVLDGATFNLLYDLFPFETNFTGGVHVATGDLTGDGIEDIITASGPGRVGQVRTYNGPNPAGVLGDYFPYGPPPSGLTAGIQVASGDIDNDGRDDLVVAPGPGVGPLVRVLNFTGAQIAGPLGQFNAYAPGFFGGVFLSTGDVNGDGLPDIITGTGAGATPHVLIRSGATGDIIGSFFPYPVGFTGGVRVGSADLNSDGFAEIVTGAGAGGGPHVRLFNGSTALVIQDPFTQGPPPTLREEFPFNAVFTGGVFVAGSGSGVNAGSPLRVIGQRETPADSAFFATTEIVADLTAEVIERFTEAGLNEAAVERLRNVTVDVRDLGGDLLGLAFENSIVIDRDAAGFGYFVDATPGDDIEFQTATGQALAPEALGRVDLLSVIAHELGHLLGLEHGDSAGHEFLLMADRLAPGVRRGIQSEDLAALDATFGTLAHEGLAL